ncbi:hypothetical protein LCGC14_3154960, partial [marine sediment metagenome]
MDTKKIIESLSLNEVKILPYIEEENIEAICEKTDLEKVSVLRALEYLKNKKIIDKIDWCTHYDLDTFITTNAGLLDIDIANDLIKAGLTMIRFSLHAEIDEKIKDRNIANFLAIN